jgi:alkylation response protein AidB-like acyl-CoA dehydrogenase
MGSAIHRNIPDSRGTNVFEADRSLQNLLRAYLSASVQARVLPQFERMGKLVGDRLEKLALAADRNPPVLHLRARNGMPDERIEKHPAYLEMEAHAFGAFGLAAMSHRPGVFGAGDRLPPLVKYGLVFLFAQAEFGLCCPLSMTDALTRTLMKFGAPDLVARYAERLTSQDMDALYQGAMFMTEQAAGSDVGAIDTVARLEDGVWRLYGDKWFCSNPDAALAMVLARPEGGAAGTGGLSLFLLPRHLPDGARNAYRIVRLKDKLGTRSMASGEIQLDGAVAHLVGDPGQGFRQMTDMINMSRLSNGVRSAGLMRRSVFETLFITRNRVAFGRRLQDLPLMRRQILKMMVTAEQARSMVFHTAWVLEAADGGDRHMASVLRILTPLIKFRACRDARKVAGDAMEARGGCGYIEEWSDARVLRDAHLGSIWEGTSNIVALDVARAVRREDALTALTRHAERLLDEAARDGAGISAIAEAFHRAAGFLDQVANSRDAEADVRRAASAVYNATSAVIMAWEDARIRSLCNDQGGDRLVMARHVVRHKLMPRDPLAMAGSDEAAEVLLDAALRDVAMAAEARP